jgi:hypothetical protein
MKHYSYDEWLQFVRNEMNEKSREELENHLYACDHCLDHYLQAVEANESSFPALSNESGFTDLVMAGVLKQKEVATIDRQVTQSKAKSKPNTNKPFYQQAAFHYLLAAAATILLTFSGVFHSIATYAGVVENQHFQEKKPSITEGVINKTFAWMDSIENKGGK